MTEIYIMPLTAAKIRSAEARARPYKLADGQGLFLHVAVTGTKTLRFAYRFSGKEKLLVLGRVPELGLMEARERRDDARQQLRRGVDPSARRAPAAPAPANDGVPTFEAIARAWLADQADRWSPAHAADAASSLERHVFPAIGATPITAIGAQAVLRVLRAVEEGGSIETARRLRQRISAVFARAIAEEVVDVDPAARVTKALRRPAEPRHHPAALDVAGARTVLAAIDAAPGAPIAKLASRFLALTAVRWAAVRGARWDELEDLDGAAPAWRVPASRMKLARAKKGDAANDHLVPLAPAAVALLRAARDLHRGDANMQSADADLHAGLIFADAGGAPLGENVLSGLYIRAGLRGRHAPHGWRATFSTILNEARPADRAAIDLALAHTPKDKVEAAYNRSEQLGRRRELFETWASLLLDGPETRALHDVTLA